MTWSGTAVMLCKCVFGCFEVSGEFIDFFVRMFDHCTRIFDHFSCQKIFDQFLRIFDHFSCQRIFDHLIGIFDHL